MNSSSGIRLEGQNLDQSMPIPRISIISVPKGIVLLESLLANSLLGAVK